MTFTNHRVVFVKMHDFISHYRNGIPAQYGTIRRDRSGSGQGSARLFTRYHFARSGMYCDVIIHVVDKSSTDLTAKSMEVFFLPSVTNKHFHENKLNRKVKSKLKSSTKMFSFLSVPLGSRLFDVTKCAAAELLSSHGDSVIIIHFKN